MVAWVLGAVVKFGDCCEFAGLGEKNNWRGGLWVVVVELEWVGCFGRRGEMGLT
jgi:hypothetical protein